MYQESRVAVLPDLDMVRGLHLTSQRISRIKSVFRKLLVRHSSMSIGKDYGPVVAAIDQGTTSTRFMVTHLSKNSKFQIF